MAVYQNNIPQAVDQLNDSQLDIQQNFLAINDLITVDHEDFNGGAGDEGKHKQVTFPESAGDPGTGANEMAVYSKVSALGALGTALYLQHEGAGTVTDFTSSTQAVDGWTRLPSGILLKWGTGTANGLASVQAFPVAATVPVFTAVYQITISANAGGGLGNDDYSTYLVGSTINNMTVNGRGRTANAARNGTYTYLAIGI